MENGFRSVYCRARGGPLNSGHSKTSFLGLIHCHVHVTGAAACFYHVTGRWPDSTAHWYAETVSGNWMLLPRLISFFPNNWIQIWSLFLGISFLILQWNMSPVERNAHRATSEHFKDNLKTNTQARDVRFLGIYQLQADSLKISSLNDHFCCLENSLNGQIYRVHLVHHRHHKKNVFLLTLSDRYSNLIGKRASGNIHDIWMISFELLVLVQGRLLLV